MLAPKARAKPPKPYPSFPLTAHNNGQWCKKIRGKVHFFGVWEDPQAALNRYLAVAADLHAGRRPHAGTLSPDGIVVKEACNRFLTYQLNRAESAEIGHRWFEDCRCVLDAFSRFVGSGRPVGDLLPDDFQRFRQRLVRHGLADKKRGLGVHALNRAITVVRSALKFAYETDLIERPVKYGKCFERPSATLKRRSRRLAEQENGKRLFEASEIGDMLEASSESLHAMILLGINGGFGNTDCARLPVAAVNLSRGVIEFDRPKTAIDRVLPLWPDTTESLRQVLNRRPQVSDKGLSALFFLRPTGLPWIEERVHRAEDGSIERVTRVDAIADGFDALLLNLGLKRKGIGFYTLRHTFRTWADEVRDQHAIHRIMGHVIPGMSGIYIEKIDLNRLRAVVDHVRSKIYGESAASSSDERPAPAST